MDKQARRQLTVWMIGGIVVIIILFIVALNGFDWILDLNYGHRE